MSKPIINGIDVSECEYFKTNRGFNCYKGYNCTDKECTDCYFKQFKRLEQVNQQLNQVIKSKDKLIEKYASEYKEVKDKKDEYYRQTLDDTIQLNELMLENKKLRQVRKNSPDIQEPYIYLYRQIKKQCHKLEEENKRYKQALEEIRDRLIAVTEEEPQSTQNLVLDLKPIIEGVLNDRD